MIIDVRNALSGRNALSAVRAGYGAAQLLFPELVTGRLAGRGLDTAERFTARVLGARQLVQAVVSGNPPGRRALLAGAGVDILHAASMVALAVAEPRRRRLAGAETATALCFAAAGLLAAGGDTGA
jgi:hypothetical protein